MIEDDRLLSVGNVYYAMKNRYPNLDISEPPIKNKMANLDCIAKMAGITVDGSLSNRPINAKALKIALSILDQKLLSEYALLEYISSNGGSWIDTGYAPNYRSKVVFHCEPTQASANTGDAYFPIMGARVSQSNNSKNFVLWANGAVSLRVDYQTSQNSYTDLKNVGRNGYILDGYNKKFYVNGVGFSLNGSYFTCPSTLLLFACNNQTGGADKRTTLGKIFECSIYDEYERLIKWLLPAKKKSNGAIGMYDVVNEVFIEGSGVDFVAGPEIFDMPTFSISGYSLLECASSNGDTFFDTGITPNQDTRFLLEFNKRTNDATLDQYAFCSRGSSTGAFGLVSKNNEHRWRDDYNTEKNSASGVNLTQRMLLDKNKNITYFPTMTITHTKRAFTTPNSMGIFGSLENGGTRAYAIDMNFYWGCIYENGEIKRLYFPYKRVSDNVVGLYDFVNNTFAVPVKGTLSSGVQIVKQ